MKAALSGEVAEENKVQITGYFEKGDQLPRAVSPSCKTSQFYFQVGPAARGSCLQLIDEGMNYYL